MTRRLWLGDIFCIAADASSGRSPVGRSPGGEAPLVAEATVADATAVPIASVLGL